MLLIKTGFAFCSSIHRVSACGVHYVLFFSSPNWSLRKWFSMGAVSYTIWCFDLSEHVLV